MVRSIKGRVTGTPEVMARLKKLDNAVQKKIVRRAVAHGGSLFLKAAKQRVPKRTGLLKKSLGKKAKTYRGSGVHVSIIGPRKGFATATANPVKYAHLVEFGTVHSRAKPFMRPAYEETKDLVEKAFVNIVRNGIEDEMK